MAQLFAFLSRLADRPSTIWRIAWLLFCLIVLCFFGARTLRRIAPYVLAGIGKTPTAPLLPAGSPAQQEDDGKFATFVLPIICWIVLTSALAWLLIA
jgi:hypothetical protein